MRTNRNIITPYRWGVAALAVTFIMGCNVRNSPTVQDFSTLSPKIVHALDNISSYEMTVSYSERAKAGNALSTGMTSESTSLLKFKRPDLLSLTATNTTTQGIGSTKKVQKITLYTTFDGKQQKFRNTVVTGGKSSTHSGKLTLALNPPDQPFNGWNIKGLGLAEGTDYIGTVKGMLQTYDYVKASRKQDIAEYKGTFNADKYTAALSRTMPREQAKAVAWLAGRTAGEIRLRVDTKTNLVIGYTQTDTVADRTCRFNNIKLNPALHAKDFDFRALPGEHFDDITDLIKTSRARSRTLFAPVKPHTNTGN